MILANTTPMATNYKMGDGNLDELRDMTRLYLQSRLRPFPA
jgi:hypothetical protein